MVLSRIPPLVVLVSIACLLSLPVAVVGAVGSPVSVDPNGSSDAGPDVDVPTIESESSCLSGSGSSFTVGSEDGANIWIRLHVATLTDSGGSFGADLAGSTADDRIVEVVAGIEYTGDGFWDFVSDPIGTYDLVSAVDIQLPMFDDVATPAPGGESAVGDEGTADERAAEQSRDDSPFELLDC